MQDPAKNRVYQQVMALQQLTPEESVYLTAGQTPFLYLLYFAGRNAWNLRTLSRNPDFLVQEIDRHKQMTPIFISNEALQLDTTEAWSSKYRILPLAQIPQWSQLQ
jgi:hypothetical protein